MKIFRNTFLQHLVFWVLSWFILLNHFQASSELVPTDYIFTAIFLFFLMVAVYFNLFLLFKVEKHKYGVYWSGLAALLLSLAFTFILVKGFDPAIEMLFPNYYLISYFDYLRRFIR